MKGALVLYFYNYNVSGNFSSVSLRSDICYFGRLSLLLSLGLRLSRDAMLILEGTKFIKGTLEAHGSAAVQYQC